MSRAPMPDRRAFLVGATALPLLAALPRADALPPEWEELAAGLNQWVPADRAWEVRAVVLRAYREGFSLADYSGVSCGTVTRHGPLTLFFGGFPLPAAAVCHDEVQRYRLPV